MSTMKHDLPDGNTVTVIGQTTATYTDPNLWDFGQYSPETREQFDNGPQIAVVDLYRVTINEWEPCYVAIRAGGPVDHLLVGEAVKARLGSRAFVQDGRIMLRTGPQSSSVGATIEAHTTLVQEDIFDARARNARQIEQRAARIAAWRADRGMVRRDAELTVQWKALQHNLDAAAAIESDHDQA